MFACGRIGPNIANCFEFIGFDAVTKEKERSPLKIAIVFTLLAMHIQFQRILFYLAINGTYFRDLLSVD